jgi:hypothetical protein
LEYLSCAVDKAGATVDFLLTGKRDRKAARRFLRKAIGQNRAPEQITIDKSGANTAAIESYNTEPEAGIEIRQVKYLNNIVEQDHRPIKRQVRPMLGFQSFRSAAVTLAGVKLMHMIRKGQLRAVWGCAAADSVSAGGAHRPMERAVRTLPVHKDELDEGDCVQRVRARNLAPFPKTKYRSPPCAISLCLSLPAFPSRNIYDVNVRRSCAAS